MTTISKNETPQSPKLGAAPHAAKPAQDLKAGPKPASSAMEYQLGFATGPTG